MKKARSGELEQARIRLANAQAEKYELKNAQMRREYVSIKEVNEAYGKLVSNIKTKLLALPGKLAYRLVHEEAREIDRILTENIYEVLKEFASDSIV